MKEVLERKMTNTSLCYRRVQIAAGGALSPAYKTPASDYKDLNRV